MTDEVYRAFGFDLGEYLEDIFGIAAEGAVSVLVECGCLRVSRAYVVEENHFVFIGKEWNNVAPHTLITAVAVREHYRLFARADDPDVVSLEYVHKDSGLVPVT